MRYDDALAKHEPLDEYERGYVDGLYQYAWHKDGVLYVGTTGRTLGAAVDQFLTEHRERMRV